jgi:hypothetical protein
MFSGVEAIWPRSCAAGTILAPLQESRVYGHAVEVV